MSQTWSVNENESVIDLIRRQIQCDSLLSCVVRHHRSHCHFGSDCAYVHDRCHCRCPIGCHCDFGCGFRSFCYPNGNDCGCDRCHCPSQSD